VRFYEPNLAGFVRFLRFVLQQVDAASLLVGSLYIPPLRVFELWVCNFARAYMLCVHYDVYQSSGVTPLGFSPNKVMEMLSHEMPRIIIDAMRELFRPVVTPDGYILYPSPNTLYRDWNYDPAHPLRALVPLGEPDEGLLRYGIFYFRSIPRALQSTWAGGQMSNLPQGSYLEIVPNIGKEGLEPTKFAAVIKVDSAIPRGDTTSGTQQATRSAAIHREHTRYNPDLDNCRVNFPNNHNLDIATWLDSQVFPNGIPTHRNERGVMFIFSHDFYAEDMERELAVRTLQPIVLELRNDPTIRFYDRIDDPFPISLQFLGADVYRGDSPVTFFQFQNEIVSRLEGEKSLFDGEYYLNRISSGYMVHTMQNWRFPSIGSRSPIMASKETKKGRKKGSKPTVVAKSKKGEPVKQATERVQARHPGAEVIAAE